VTFAHLHDFFKLSRNSARLHAPRSRDNANGPSPPEEVAVNVIYLATSAAIVPEPTTVALIALGAVALLVRQIRRLRRPRAARLP
jgi:hypothetical protein